MLDVLRPYGRCRMYKGEPSRSFAWHYELSLTAQTSTLVAAVELSTIDRIGYALLGIRLSECSCGTRWIYYYYSVSIREWQLLRFL